MRILELRCRNLNSLYGDCKIDFRAPEYVSDGIFAITGPTGAGKSTILDALCLALYGGTPRLGRITKSSNEIMSRHTGECSAEVLFETQEGTYRCSWSQHRARKKADGLLAEARHEISDALTGNVLSAKKKDSSSLIEQKTGMDFDRFTRSMLLAQGGFAAFLQATADQRSPILEQITGTELYTDISKAVHELNNEQQNKLACIQAEMKEITVLSDEQKDELNTFLEKSRQQLQDTQGRLETISRSVRSLQELCQLKEHIAELEHEQQEINRAIDDFRKDRESLKSAEKASVLDGPYSKLSSLREQQADEDMKLKTYLRQIPEAEETFKKAGILVESKNQASDNAKEKLREEGVTAKYVHSLDNTITNMIIETAAVEEAYSKSEKLLKELQQKTDEFTKVRDAASEKIDSIEQFFHDHAPDSSLVSGLGSIREKLSFLKTAWITLDEKKSELELQDHEISAAQEDIENLKKEFTKRDTQYGNVSKKIAETEQDLKELLSGKTIREYYHEKDQLLREMSFLNRIASLEEERTKLQDDIPCPLCGSVHHPYAEGNIPPSGETEQRLNELSLILEHAEGRTQSLKELGDDEKEAGASRNEVLSGLEKSKLLLDHMIDRKASLEKDLRALKTQYDTNKNQVMELLTPLDIHDITGEKTDYVLKELSQRLDSWNNNVREKELAVSRMHEAEAQLGNIQGRSSVLEQSLEEHTARYETASTKLSVLQEERFKLYGKKDPEKEIALLETACAESEKAGKSAEEALQITLDEVNRLKHLSGEFTQSVKAREPKIRTMEVSFLELCEKHGFFDENTYLSACLPLEKRTLIAEQSKQLDAKLSDIRTRKKDRENRISLLEKDGAGLESLDVLEEQEQDARTKMESLGEEIGVIKERLEQDRNAQSSMKQKISRLEAHRILCDQWKQLHRLIGSSDGKKFRNFAQGLTFELLVKQSNRQLAKMTDRYLLIRDEDMPLELNVIDNYQGGEIRSTKNLSGGESFLVSLSLALGLSRMSSRKVRVDSLFLDEGFGTLDEQTLETALEALSSLQQEGKLIGVISHVGALQERIPAQIMVVPISEGKSSISGPGCSSVRY